MKPLRSFFLCVYITLFSCFSAFGQNGSAPCNVSGVLTDSLGAPVQDANIIFGAKGEKKTYYASSDVKGCFSVNLPDGGYSMGITHLSYKDLMAEVVIKADTTLRYKLTASSNKLSEVKVYGDFIRRKGAGFTVKVRGNPLAEDRSVLSFMNELPGIRGTSVNGGRAAIYINGREMKMSNDELLRYLSSIPTESIEELSARASKSAAARASGAPTAIYITLRKTADPRYSGQVLLSPSLNYKNGTLSNTLGGSLGYFDKKWSSLAYVSLTKIAEEKTAENKYSGKKEMSKSDRDEWPLMFDYSLFYDIDAAHAVGVGANILYKPDYKTAFKYYGDVSSPFNKKNTMGKNREDLFINYRYFFGKRKSTWNLKADVLSDKNKHSEKYKDMANAIGTSYNDNYLNYGLQSNLNLCLTDDAELKIGADYLSVDSYRKYDIPFSGNIDKFKFKEHTFGAYTEFFTPLSFLELTVGLRYEHNFTKMTDVESPLKFKNIWDNDVFPTVDLSYNGDNYSVSLSYDKSISRSKMSYYAPFVSQEGEFIIEETGSSPFVRPAYSNDISLSQTFANAHTFGLKYSWTKDASEDVYLREGDYIKKVELPDGLRKEFQAFYMSNLWIVKNKISTSISASGAYSDIKNEERTERFWLADCSASLTYHLPKSWKIEVNGSYSSPSRTSSLKTSALWNSGFSVSKNIGKNWRLTLMGDGIVHSKTITTTSTINGVDYVGTVLWNVTAIGASIVYKFNNFMGKKTLNINEVRWKSGK